MLKPIIGLAQNFSLDELREILRTPEMKRGYAFVGAKCQCGKLANIPVHVIWTFHWMCSCGKDNEFPRIQHHAVHGKPDIGPPRGIINEIFDGLVFPDSTASQSTTLTRKVPTRTYTCEGFLF